MLPLLPTLLLLFLHAAAGATHTVHISIFRIPTLILAHKLGVQEYVLHHIFYALIAFALLYRWDSQRRYERGLGAPMIHSSSGSSKYYALPWLGHALTFWLHSPWDVLLSWHKERSWTPAVAFPLLGRYMFSIASPSLVKAILQTKISHTAKDLQHSLQPFLSILGQGLVSSHGKAWMEQRKRMSQPIRVQVLDEIPRHTVAAVERLQDTYCHGPSVPIGHALRQLTLQVISSAFLSLPPDESDETFAKLYLPIVEESNRRVWHPYRKYALFLPAFWKYLYYVYQLNTYVSRLIRERWEERRGGRRRSKKDVLDYILDSVPHQHGALSAAQVRQFRDEIKTFVLAGHETSAAAMTWTLYELMANPALMEQVRKEANAVLGTGGGVPEDVSQLVLAEACLKVSVFVP